MRTTIKEKALRIAECDSYNVKCHTAEPTDALQEEFIKNYSSFDKLMELLEDINSYSFEDGYYIIIEAFYVYLKHTGKGLIKNYEYNRNGIILKEALMDCLLEYYKQTKGVHQSKQVITNLFK